MKENRPGIMALSGDAKIFVRDHYDDLKRFAVVLLPPMLVAQAVSDIGQQVVSPFCLLAVLFVVYFSSCLILDWHRLVLTGRPQGEGVNPFRLQKSEGGFVLVFLLLSTCYAIPILISFVPLMLGGLHKDTHLAVFGLLTLPVAIAVMLWISLRFSFLLPARSVGVHLTLRETGPIARGLKWRLFAAGFMAAILPILLTVCIVVASGIIVHSILHLVQDDGKSLTLTGAIVSFVLQGIPTTIISFIVTTRYVTILSRLYQWSVQNRSLPSARVSA